jgi:biopolymer transport protein ExbB/TolQ
VRAEQQRDRYLGFGLLLAIALLVHVAYVFFVRPEAQRHIAEQATLAEQQPDRKSERSAWVILKDPEQEIAIILGLWALSLAIVKAREIRRHRRQLDKGLLRVPPGFRILPTDVRDYARQLEELPLAERALIPARTIRHALKRFGETANVQDAATAVHDYSESESARLDSELSMIRFCVWAIPAIGFVGTVRGIGDALGGAQQAIRGDTSSVTGGLGVAFNSTLVALIISIVIMFVIHELQLRQERLVLDTEFYVDDTVISNLQSR